jgi:hypothetical protein
MNEQQPPSEGSVPEKIPVKAAQIEAVPPKQSKKPFAQRLFDRETKFGRGMRAFTRGLGLVTGLFALGVMVTYVLLVQPLERGRREAQTALAQANSALQTLRADLKLAQSSLSTAETRLEDALAAASGAQSRIDLQRARVKVLESRLALATDDPAAAKMALDEVEKLLADFDTPQLKRVLDLARGDLARSADLADQDLQRLYSELELIEQNID